MKKKIPPREPSGKRLSRLEIKGQEIDENLDRDEYDGCLETAMRIIMFADNSKKMMRDKLSRKGYSNEIVHIVIDRMVEKKLINDEHLLDSMAHTLAIKKFYGRSRVKQELLLRFDRESVDAFLDKSLRDVSFNRQANEFAAKNYAKGKDRLIRAMKARGYDSRQIMIAIEKVEDELREQNGGVLRQTREIKTPKSRRNF